jgi:hypothetical protein
MFDINFYMCQLTRADRAGARRQAPRSPIHKPSKEHGQAKDMAMNDFDRLNSPSSNPQIATLRGKIGWICQSVRLAAAAYAVWVLYLLATYWSDAAAINNGYGRLLQKDLSGIAPWQQAAAFGVNFVIWLLAAVACYSAWRLFTTYLAGKIFTLTAAIWLRRLAVYGVAAQALGIITRPLVSVILTMRFPEGQRMVNIFLQPDDLAIMLLLLGLLALAHIHKTAAEIAGEHAQFV